MTMLKNKSHHLGAAIVLANAMFLLAAPANASVQLDGPQSSQVIMESVTGFFSNDVAESAQLDEQSIFQTVKNASDLSSFRVSANIKTKMQMQQATGTPNNAGSYQNGATGQPMQATAGEVMKKLLKKLTKEHCGKPNSIC